MLKEIKKMLQYSVLFLTWTIKLDELVFRQVLDNS